MFNSAFFIKFWSRRLKSVSRGQILQRFASQKVTNLTFTPEHRNTDDLLRSILRQFRDTFHNNSIETCYGYSLGKLTSNESTI